MVVERFRPGCAAEVYRRFRERGRLAPAGLVYVASWVDLSITTCYQVMECDDRRLLDAWTSQWEDLVAFEVIPVMTSAAAGAAMLDREDATRADHRSKWAQQDSNL
jgi:hypothetical protein